MISRLKPIMTTMIGSDIEDLWFVEGDPISYMSDLCEESIFWLFGVRLEPFESVRVRTNSEILGRVFNHREERMSNGEETK